MAPPVLTTNVVLLEVLGALGVPHIEERLSRDFFYELGLAFPQQYGIACHSVASCVRVAEAHGAGPFLHVTMKPPNWTERGQKKDCTLEFALGYAGDAEIELLGPGKGTDHYADALSEADVALHHVGIYQTGMERIAPVLESHGYPTVVTGGLSLGRALKIDFRYFDARKAHDLYLEILDFQLLGLPLSTGPAIRAHSTLRRHLTRRGQFPFSRG